MYGEVTKKQRVVHLNSFIASDKQNYVDKALYFSENINLLEKERNKLFNQVYLVEFSILNNLE